MPEKIHNTIYSSLLVTSLFLTLSIIISCTSKSKEPQIITIEKKLTFSDSLHIYNEIGKKLKEKERIDKNEPTKLEKYRKGFTIHEDELSRELYTWIESAYNRGGITWGMKKQLQKELPMLTLMGEGSVYEFYHEKLMKIKWFKDHPLL